jgi:hypothetical protein
MSDARDAGKGDTYRPVDKKKYADNYDRIFKVADIALDNSCMWCSPKGLNDRTRCLECEYCPGTD